MVKYPFDTSIFAAASISSHERHAEAMKWLGRIIDGTDRGVVAAHSIAEFYAVATTIPVRPRVSAAGAAKLIAGDMFNAFEVVSLDATDYLRIVQAISDIGVLGGATYDALIAYSGLKASVDAVVTFNQRDFVRVCPALVGKVIYP